MQALSNHKECANCGSNHKSRPFCIYPDGYHCFSCGYTKRGDRSFSNNPQQPQFKSKIDGFNFEFESQLTKFPIEYQEYLTKFYITQQHLDKYYIKMVGNCLYYPAIHDNRVLFAQRRMLTPRMVISEGGSKVYAETHAKGQDRLILVEDYISYSRIANSGFSVVCLFGTKCYYEKIQEWFTKYKKILVWLDNDAEKETNSGQIAAQKIIHNCKSVIRGYNRKRGFTENNKHVVNIATKNDPKCYTDTEIKLIIGGAL